MTRWAGGLRRSCPPREAGRWTWAAAPGGHARLLAERFAHVDAVNVSGPMIALARAKHARANITYRQAGLLEVGGAVRYDLVLSVATLHHLADLDAALRHLRTLVAPGGRAVLVDVVSHRPAVPRWWLHGGELRKLVGNLARRGPAQAWEIYRLASGAWLDHRVSDRYFSRDQFRRRYQAVFPAARFHDINRTQGMVWDAPTADSVADSHS